MKNNMLLKHVVAIATLLLSLIHAQANAAFTSRDLVLGSGDGLLTYDDQANFEWLDVATLNLLINFFIIPLLFYLEYINLAYQA